MLYETESATWSNSGGALIGMGDQDGDGHAEFIVGASHNSTEEHWAGAVYQINGDALTESGSVQYMDELASAVLHGTTQYGYVGFSVADAGDVNGDGEADLLTGTANMEMPSHLVYGPLSGSLSADVIFSPETSNSSGQEVSSAQDTNNDGYDDVMISAPLDSSGTGAIYLVRGPMSATVDLTYADAIIYGDAYGFAGESIDAAGDTDGDGVSELLIGAPEYSAGSGHAYLVAGTITGTFSLASADGTLSNIKSYSGLGTTVSGVGDVSGDGLDDILVAAPEHNGLGAVFLFHGGSL